MSRASSGQIYITFCSLNDTVCFNLFDRYYTFLQSNCLLAYKFIIFFNNFISAFSLFSLFVFNINFYFRLH